MRLKPWLKYTRALIFFFEMNLDVLKGADLT